MITVTCSHLGLHLDLENFQISASEVGTKVQKEWNFQEDDFYLLYNGKILPKSAVLTCGVVYAVPRLIGGKGGFGSMLRAIGAQIEKTTNREACRDLSGRRLRDINEEKRLKNWIIQQADREREAAERKKKKLERLRAQPKHEFHDKCYEEERSQLAEKVSDAVEQGFKVASNENPGVSLKRKAAHAASTAVQKKKTCLWLDPDEDELSSSLDSDDSDDEEPKPGSSKSVDKSSSSGELGNVPDINKPSTSTHDRSGSSSPGLNVSASES